MVEVGRSITKWLRRKLPSMVLAGLGVPEAESGPTRTPKSSNNQGVDLTAQFKTFPK